MKTRNLLALPSPSILSWLSQFIKGSPLVNTLVSLMCKSFNFKIIGEIKILIRLAMRHCSIFFACDSHKSYYKCWCEMRSLASLDQRMARLGQTSWLKSYGIYIIKVWRHFFMLNKMDSFGEVNMRLTYGITWSYFLIFMIIFSFSILISFHF